MAMPSDTRPYWADSAAFPQFPKLSENVTADVAIVGGGITGLTTAYLLAEAGRTVVLLERGRCASIDTGHTTAHLTMVTDARLHELVDGFGRAHAQAAWDAGFAAIAEIERLVIALDLDANFDWVDSYLYAALGCDLEREVETLKQDASYAAEFGFDAEFIDSVPVAGRPGVRFGSQARFHPRAYLAGLARAFAANGGRIFEHSPASEFTDQPLSVTANGHKVSCGDIVIATHTPLVGIGNMAAATLSQTKLALYTSYVLAGKVPKDTVTDALFWDTGDPYLYFRIDPHHDFDVVIFGGEDHKTGQAADTDACYRRLQQKLESIVPDIEITHRWSAQVIETPDGLPYIGRDVEHQYSATGFAGNGMTFGTVSALMMTDAILGRRNPWTDLFDPARKAIGLSTLDYIRENADYPYYLVRDYLAAPEARSVRSIKRGEGRIVERKGEKVAASRDDKGRLTMRSATCTHMGCIVKWNTAERTWDCPCHGSRFTPAGRVIAGPAESPLAEVDE
jgi:glycine/D-amino acid oxidase-like deaminating enzyme/nitrite reductase/ring-hydroxylating ferredoxin subunit